MSKRDFTPEQSEIILEAVKIFLLNEGNAYVYVKHLNDLLHAHIQNNIEYNADTSDGRIALNPLYLSEILLKNETLTDLLFDIQDAVNEDYFLTSHLNVGIQQETVLAKKV